MLTKKHLLIFSILLSCNHSKSGFFDPFNIVRNGINFIEQLTQEERPQKQTSSNNSQSLSKFLAQYRENLAGLPTDEIDEIINQTAQQLQRVNLTQSDFVENVKRSVLIEYSKYKINLEISAYEVQKNIKFDDDLRQFIQDRRQGALINHIEKINHPITGNDIKTFFGEYRKNGMEQVCIVAAKKQKERQNQYFTPSAPSQSSTTASYPSAPPAPKPQTLVIQNRTNTDYLSQNDIDTLNDKLSGSSENDSLEHTKTVIGQLLKKQLTIEEKELKESSSYNPRDIENAIEETKTQKMNAIKKLQKIDACEIAKIIGNSRDGMSNIKTAVYNNLQKQRN